MNPPLVKRYVTSLCAAGALLALGYGLARVRADGAPTSQPIWYSGTVTDSAGAPVEGDHSVTLRLFPPTGSAAVCTVGPSDAAFQNGRFRVDASACLTAMRANPDTFAELTVDDETFPRSKVGAVPYAIEAERALSAQSAEGALKTSLDQMKLALDQAPKITSWTAYTPTVYVGTQMRNDLAGERAGRYRRVGDTAEIQIQLKTVPVAGIGSGVIYVGLPAGIEKDPSKLVPLAKVGYGNLFVHSGTNYLIGVAFDDVAHGDRAAFFMENPVATTTITSTNPYNMATESGGLEISLFVPVKGWTVNTP